MACDLPRVRSFAVGYYNRCVNIFPHARNAAAHFAGGRGYATEGSRAALDFAFNELQRPEVVAMTTPVNVRSQRVMQRLGMTRDPRDDFEHPNVREGHPLRTHVLFRLKRPVDG